MYLFIEYYQLHDNVILIYCLPAVVDFPTPPFPDATTMTLFTPAMGFCLGSPLAMCCLCFSCSLSVAPEDCHHKHHQDRVWSHCQCEQFLLDMHSLCTNTTVTKKNHTRKKIESRRDSKSECHQFVLKG